MKNDKVLKLAVVAFFILALGYWGIGLYFFPSNGMFQWNDSENVSLHNGSDAVPQWQQGAYLFHGKDPYRLISQQDPPVEGIGMMHDKMRGTMPWCPFLFQFIFPGFLPFSVAVWWGMALFIGLMSVVSVMVYKLTLKRFGNPLIALLVVAVMLAQYGFAPELKWLNVGGHVVGLLLIACLLDDKKHWFIIGVLLGFAMIKPQLAIMFFLPHLFRKNYKIIAVSIIIVVVPWLANAIMFSHNPITLLLDYYKISAETQVANGHAYFGLLDPLSKWFGINPLVISPFQMAFCFIVCGMLCYKFRQTHNYLLFSIPAVFSTFWTYSNEVNLPVLALLIISIIFYLAEKDFSIKKLDTIFLCFAIIVMAAPFTSSFRLYHFPVLAPLFQRCVFLIALGIVLNKFSKTHKKPSICLN